MASASRTNGLDVRVKEDVPMEVRDGTVLRADVYTPTAAGSYPVLLQRTPYDKASDDNVATARELAARGYIVAVQDIRGRYASDGKWVWAYQDPADTSDAQDGYETVEWAAGLSGSDGQVGTWGHSYPSWCVWQLAGTAPPSLGAAFASGMSSQLMAPTFGIFETGRRLQWTHNMAVDARRRTGEMRGPSTRAEADTRWYEVERGKWIWHLPLDDIPDYVFSTLSPMLKRYMREQNKEFWAFDKIHSRVNVATCQVTGWYDRLVGTIENFSGMVKNGPASLRDQHRIVIGPWGHDNGAFVGRQGP
jgi:putative CocE/NonD family hydrolase